MAEHRIEDDLALDVIEHGGYLDPSPAERWIADDFERGFADLEEHVAKQADFLDFLNARGDEFPI